MKSLNIGIATLVISLQACGTEEAASSGPQVESVVKITGPLSGAVVEGIVEINVEATLASDVSKVELMRDTEVLATATAAPFTLTWNTADEFGMAEVFARATGSGGDRLDSPTVQLLLSNGGDQVIDVSREMLIPSLYNGTQEVDVKHHWTNVAGMHRIAAVARWTPAAGQTSWEIELAVGTGTCPHSGETLAGPEGSLNGPVFVTYEDAAELAQIQHFAHLHPVNPDEHVGERLAYEVEVFVAP